MRWRILGWTSALLLLSFLGCGDGGGGGGGGGGTAAAPPGVDPAPPDDPPPPNAPAPLAPVHRTYYDSTDDFPNPERGLYDWIDLVNGRDFSRMRQSGQTLGFASVSLASYRTSLIDAAFLGKLAAGFQALRNSGVKAILRFKYATSLGSADTTKSWILTHLEQLTPLFVEYGDVIAVFQAGFIGAWGEWHTSTNGLDNPTDRADILRAVLAAVPASIQVQVRVQKFKKEVFGNDPVSEGEAYTTTGRARVGHHNDAFLSNETDGGTYPRPVPESQDWLALESRFVATGGETNRLNPPRTDGPNAIWEMERYHFSFLSRQYHRYVVSGWESTGHLAVIRRRLGYRFALREASWTPAAPPGGVLDLGFQIENLGFAAATNERPVYAVLSGPGGHREARLGAADPRRWPAGAVSPVSARLRLPADLPPGRYRLALRFPDREWRLSSLPAFSIRLASEGVWDAQGGLNVLTEEFSIDPSAPGPVDPRAPDFAEALTR